MYIIALHVKDTGKEIWLAYAHSIALCLWTDMVCCRFGFSETAITVACFVYNKHKKRLWRIKTNYYTATKKLARTHINKIHWQKQKGITDMCKNQQTTEQT